MRFFARDAGRWLSVHRRWGLHAALVVAIAMLGCHRVCESRVAGRPLPCPLSPEDLQKVTAWIATEVARIRQPFCWRHSYTDVLHKCRSGYTRVLTGCWQKCSPGRKDCGAGCASSGGDCAKSTLNMVVEPLLLAVNIATLGTGSGATTGARAASKVPKIKQLAKQAGRKTDRKSAKSDRREDTIEYALEVTTDEWVKDYVAEFDVWTTPEIASELKRRFSGDALLWIEEQYALTQLALILEADGNPSARETLATVATFDPSGVTGVIDAFAQPKCRDPQPFPAVTLLPPYAQQ